MDKNWLIRTQTNKIFGPISKGRVVELIEQNALGPQDEVAKGNGHWFWIKEKELVKKYLYGDETHPEEPLNQKTTENSTETESAVDETVSFQLDREALAGEEASPPPSGGSPSPLPDSRPPPSEATTPPETETPKLENAKPQDPRSVKKTLRVKGVFLLLWP